MAMTYPTAPNGPSFNFQQSEGATKFVLFFSGRGMADGRFNFWEIGNGLGVHRLFVNNGRDRWYQDGIPGLGESLDETVSAIGLWAKNLGVREIYAVGLSMGAFGAILYGSKLGARVLAFGAETILNLEGSHSIRMLEDRKRCPYPDLHEVIAAARMPIFGFAGERHPVDLYCMSKVAGLPNYHARSLKWVGHGIPSHLHNRSRLVPLIEQFLANQNPPAMKEDGDALARPGFPEAFYELHRQLTAGRHARAAEAGKLALSLYGQADHAFYLTGKALMGLKKQTQARPYLETALAMAPKMVDYRHAMACCLVRSGEKDRGVSMLEAIVTDRPDSAASLHELGRLHFLRGDHHEALHAARRAAELKPQNRKFADLRNRIEKRLAARSLPGRLYRSLVDSLRLGAWPNLT